MLRKLLRLHVPKKFKMVTDIAQDAPDYLRMDKLDDAVSSSFRAKHRAPQLDWGTKKVKQPLFGHSEYINIPRNFESSAFGEIVLPRRTIYGSGTEPQTYLHELFHRINASSKSSWNTAARAAGTSKPALSLFDDSVTAWRRGTAIIKNELLASAGAIHTLRKMKAPAEVLASAQKDLRAALRSYKVSRLLSSISPITDRVAVSGSIGWLVSSLASLFKNKQ